MFCTEDKNFPSFRQMDKNWYNVMVSQNVDVYVFEECIRGSFKMSIKLIFSCGEDVLSQCSLYPIKTMRCSINSN